jgi:hypothetical protein
MSVNKNIIIYFCFILLSILLSNFSSYSQDNPPRTTRQLSKYEQMFPQKRYGENIYQTGSNWINIGLGKGYCTNFKKENINFSIAYHHRYKALFFRAGWHFSGPEFVMRRPMEQLNDIHIGGGIRFEERWYNIAFFIGPSFASTWIPKDSNPNISTVYNQLGAHTELQLTFKYFYDLGIGTSLYGSFNKRYQVIGAQLHFYFSNAFVQKY